MNAQGLAMLFHDVEQNSDAWLALRIGKATGSNFGTFMAKDGGAFGEPAKKYALQIALELDTGRKAEYSFGNEHTERGHEQEPLAKMLYEEENFIDVGNGGFFDWGTYGDSPDGLVGDDGVLEIKSVTAAVHYATLMRKDYDPAYRWQLVGHIDCTQRAWVDFASFCAEFREGRQLIVHRLYRDECVTELERLRQRRADFLGLVQDTLRNISD